MKVHLAELMRADLISPRLEAADKESLFAGMTRPLVDTGILDEQQHATLVDAINQREDFQCTAIDRGLALPHAYVADLPRNFILLARAPEGVDFGSTECGLVHIVFLLIGPKRDNREHLMILARIVRMLKDETFRRELESAPDGEALMRAVEDVDRRHA
jgi:mannitol/fructose-specific phosphotransferase system IIA component (Ntr-type)